MHHLFVKGLEGRTKRMQASASHPAGSDQRDRLSDRIKIPTQFLRIASDIRQTDDAGPPVEGSDGRHIQSHLRLRLRGGKGGLGPIQRSAVTKAGQKKTRSDDAHADRRGRRLRLVNAKKGDVVFHTYPGNVTKEGGVNVADMHPLTHQIFVKGLDGKTKGMSASASHLAVFEPKDRFLD